MNASNGRTLGIILIILLVLMIAWPLKYLFFAPSGVFHSIFNGHSLRLDHWDWWGWAGFAGFFALALLALWIAVIVWVYKDAEKRGMSGALWVVLVFFLHLLGLLIFVLVRGDHPVRVPGSPAAAPSAPPMCPKCGRISDRDHQFCPGCGERLQPRCAKCGRDIQPGWQACPNCGEKL
jgi:RNA polymerase subunit RPABC4/transcription elongation factor Spt4